MDYERRIEATAAYDKRHLDPKYGVHGVEFRFSLIGETAAVSVTLSTGWLLPRTLGLAEVDSGQYRRALAERSISGLYPLPLAMCFHVAQPLAEYMTKSSPCDLLPGGKCYSDITYTGTDRPFFALVEGGLDGLWESLAAELSAFTDRQTEEE